MIYVGIDPGKSGGIAFVSNSGESCFFTMPLDIKELKDILIGWDKDFIIKHVFLEKAHAMPSQGVVSMFNYGYHFGQVHGLLLTLDLPHTLLGSQTWQAEMFLGTAKAGKPKARALEASRRLFPKEKFLSTARAHKPHDGMIDAALIAEYCRRTIR